MTGGASGALHQEFCELELLDEIVHLRYECKLDKSVVGDHRNSLIHTFRKWQGEYYVPANVHKAIRWSKSDVFNVDSIVDIPWKILGKAQKGQEVSTLKSQFVPAAGTSPAKFCQPSAVKRKVSGSRVAPQKKKVKTNHVVDSLPTTSISVPQGTCWHNNSCAYDSVVSILYGIWQDDRTLYSNSFRNLNGEFLGLLVDGFSRYYNGEYSLEDVRDLLRHHLHQHAPQSFPWGRDTSVDAILYMLLATRTPVLSSNLSCPQCHPVARDQLALLSNCNINVGGITSGSIQSDIDLFVNVTGSKCTTCNDSLLRKFKFVCSPQILAYPVSGVNMTVNHTLAVPVEGQLHQYCLRGVIYHGSNHFTTRFISSAGLVWFHDGIATGRSMEYEGMLDDVVLTQCRSKQASMSLYVLV
jgi:hypothetical protein